MRILSIYLFILTILFASVVHAKVPATQVMTLYRFNGPATIPYYEISSFRARGTASPAGTLAQGSSVVPCLVLDGGEPLTDNRGVPYVGFQVIVDSRTATPTATARFLAARKERQGLLVQNNHCSADVRYVLDIRNLYDMSKPPLFEPQPANAAMPKQPASSSTTDQIVRAFHNSLYCEAVNRQLTNRRASLNHAWVQFMKESSTHWTQSQLERARHLDYTMRTAIFEGHLERGCNAYGTCERNIVALSIRNRARESCFQRHGCTSPEDFTGVCSAAPGWLVVEAFSDCSTATGKQEIAFFKEVRTSDIFRQRLECVPSQAAVLVDIGNAEDPDRPVRRIHWPRT